MSAAPGWSTVVRAPISTASCSRAIAAASASVAGFERLGVEGTGSFSLTLDQRFEQIALAGTGLNLPLGGFTVGQVTGSDAAETLSVDGDVGAVQLGTGGDGLALGTTRAAGSYAGGAGNDTLRFTANAPVTLVGTATGFEQVTLAGNALTIAGMLGSANAPRRHLPARNGHVAACSIHASVSVRSRGRQSGKAMCSCVASPPSISTSFSRTNAVLTLMSGR